MADIFGTNPNGETLTGTSGEDMIIGFTGPDVIEGLGGNDILYGQGGNDAIAPGTGDDIVYGASSADALEVNILDYSTATGAIFADLSINRVYESGVTSGTLTGNELFNFTDLVFYIQGIVGSAFGDRLYGDSDDNFFVTGNGSDIVYGGLGSDTLVYSDGEGAVFIDLRNQRVFETDSTSTADVTSTSNIVGTDIIIDIENAAGTIYGDRFYGTSANNVFLPGAGNDVVYGQGGNDTVAYVVGSGRVFIDLEVGRVYEEGGALSSATVTGSETYVTTDILIGVTRATGSDGGDRINGSSAINRLGGAGGNDIIYGLGGDDQISGDDGDDQLIGGIGNDILIGGNGADRFFYTSTADGVDTIADFVAGTDALFFASAAFGLAPGAPVNLVIDGPATGSSAFIYDSAQGLLSYDADGAGAGGSVALAFMQISGTLSSGDFVIY